MPKTQRSYRPEAEGDELRIAGVAARYPLCAITADVKHSDTTVELGYIPKGAIILGAVIGLKTTFDASDTHTIDIGYGDSYDQIVDGFSVKQAANTYFEFESMLPIQTEDKLVKAVLTGTSSAGEARVAVLYAIPVVAWPAETSPLGTIDPGKGKDDFHTV